MEYQALTQSRPTRNAALQWVGCGALLALGVWCAVSAVAANSNAHVRVQPTVDMQVGMLTTQRGAARQTSNRQGPAPAGSLAASKVPPPPPPAASLASAGIPWLSVTAIVLSIVATAINLWKGCAPAPVQAEPNYALRALPPAEDDVTRRRPSNQMDQVAQGVKEDLARARTLTPKQVILDLQRGNARFWSGQPDRPELNAMERRALIIAQAPSVCILSCADSRVPVEILFDQGLGRIFVVRVAGNILDSTAMGSIEFSVKYLGVKVVLVMGHEGCGAVKGAMTMSAKDMDAQPAYLQTVLRSIQTNLNVAQLSKIRDNRAQDREAIITNCSSQVKRLQQNQLIADKVSKGELLVAGAFYEITSGIVDFFSLDKNGLVTDI